MEGDERYSMLTDIYSLGVMLYYMLYNDYPYKQQFRSINDKLNFPKFRKLSKPMKQLVVGMLKFKEENRLRTK